MKRIAMAPGIRSRLYRGGLLTLLASAAALLPSVARADFDSDRDLTADSADAFPCDASSTAVIFAPAQGEHGMMMFEDQWPEASDLDFNDVVLTYNYVFQVNASGQVTKIRATFNALAAGGQFNNGVSLHIPAPTSSVARITKAIGNHPSTTLSAVGGETELTVVLSPNVRELLGNAAQQVNSDPSRAVQPGEPLVVEISFASPVTLDTGAAPFDLFIFRSETPSHEIHRPEFTGTGAMDQSLFGRGVDGSAGTRNFVDKSGLPFALNLPQVTEYPKEGKAISRIYPHIVDFASSGGRSAQDFYQRDVVAQDMYTPAGGVARPEPQFIGPDHVPAETGCVSSWGLAVDFGASRNLFAYKSAIDSVGNVIVTGYVRGAFPGKTSAGGLDLFVAKYNGQTGAEMWVQQFGGSGDETGRDVFIDSTNNIYIAGETQSSFGGQTNAGNTDAVLMKLNSEGVLQWYQDLGGSGYDYGYGVAVGANGNVYIGGGSTSNNLPGATYPGNGPNSFLAAYSSAGARLWTQQYRTDTDNSSNFNYTLDIAVDPTGAVYAVGAERRYSEDPNAAENQFLVKHDGATGAVLWTEHIGEYGYSTSSADHRYGYAYGVATDLDGGVYVTGHWYGGSGLANWGDWSRAPGDTSADATLTKFDRGGNQLWSYSLSSPGAKDDFGEAVAVHGASGNVYFTGRTDGVFTGQTGQGGTDYYVAAYDSTGHSRWLKQDGTPSTDQGYVALIDWNTGAVSVVGNTTGALGGPDAGHYDISISRYDGTSGVRSTNVIASKLGWVTSAWGACSVSCGGGTQTRTVTCQRSDGVAVSDSSCVDTKPPASQSCNPTACFTYAWVTGSYGACSVSCGGGTQTRTVTCQRSDGAAVADSYCSGTKPGVSQTCNTNACYSYAWYSGAWSSCSGVCGTGTQTRSVYCQRSDGAQVDSSLCTGGAPVTSQACALTACSYTWISSDWSTCSAACGGGSQSRTVYCRRDNDSAQVADSSCSGTKPAVSQSCNTSACPTLTACATLRQQGSTTSTVYTIDPDGAGGNAAFQNFCEMSTDGGGWTHVMTLNTSDGHISRFLDSIWTDTTYGSVTSRWNDYKSLAARTLSGTELLLIVRLSNAAENGPVKGWRSWYLSGPRTFQSFFDCSIGSDSSNWVGGCNSGYSGDGRRQTSGIRSSGACASYGSALDTFTCRASNIYTNTYYGTCGSGQEAYRMSSWYRWPNNAQVGLGLQMDYSDTPFDLEAGNHMDWDSNQDPQRHNQPAAIGSDYYTPNTPQGEAWRFEWYVR